MRTLTIHPASVLVGLALAAVVFVSSAQNPPMLQRPPVECDESVAAADGVPKSYSCLRAAGAIVVDGRLDEAGWRSAEWSDLFVDIEGDSKPEPRYRTRMRLAWNDEFLFIAADMVEPHVWATLKERDQIVYHDNDFEVFVDPNGDTENYYEIEINALETIFDLFLVRTYKNGGPALHGWNVQGLQAAVHVRGTLNDPSDIDSGWSVEMAIPWETFEADGRKSPRSGDVWRMNFSRVEWRHTVVNGDYRKLPDTPEDNWVWSPQGFIDMHAPQHWGYVRFEEGPE